jgi:hypothetical protein
VSAPAAYGDADDAGSFGGKLKATGRRHREPCDLGDHRAERAMPQSLFKAYEKRLLVTRVYVNDTIGQQTGLGDGGREEVVARDTPQDLAARARSDPRGEQRSRRTVNRAIAATGHLVQRAKRQSAFRQMVVNRVNAERQYGAMTRGSSFDTLNALPKLLQNGEGRRRTHVLVQLVGK